jgi:hypothetical protein
MDIRPILLYINSIFYKNCRNSVWIISHKFLELNIFHYIVASIILGAIISWYNRLYKINAELKMQQCKIIVSHFP